LEIDKIINNILKINIMKIIPLTPTKIKHLKDKFGIIATHERYLDPVDLGFGTCSHSEYIVIQEKNNQ